MKNFMFHEVIDAYESVFSNKQSSIADAFGISNPKVKFLNPHVRDALYIYDIDDFTTLTDDYRSSVVEISGTNCVFALTSIPNDIYAEVFGENSSTFEYIGPDGKFILVQIVPNTIGEIYYSEYEYAAGIIIAIDHISLHTTIDERLRHYITFALVIRHLIEMYDADLKEDRNLLKQIANDCQIAYADINNCLKFLFYHYDDSTYPSRYKAIMIMMDPDRYNLEEILKDGE